MNTLQKLIGTSGCFYASGGSANPMPAGYACYALVVNTDSTEIDEFDHLVNGAVVTVDGASYCGVALQRGDLISFEFPVVSLTMTNSGDAVICYLEPTDYVAET